MDLERISAPTGVSAWSLGFLPIYSELSGFAHICERNMFSLVLVRDSSELCTFGGYRRVSQVLKGRKSMNVMHPDQLQGMCGICNEKTALTYVCAFYKV